MNIESKMEQLEAELAKGRSLLQQLRLQMEDTQVTVCRIEGAIQCCKELLAVRDPKPENNI